MENYKILQRLGKGAQGSVYLVQHRQEGKNYVLKQVECNDESEANKAFKEAMALNELQHPYVCGYKEFFVTWDKEVSAMFVCIVMDHYENGDLSQVLRQKRQKGDFLDELMIKKWLGQMVEALIFVHKKKVIHRDLKPSNIFMQGDLGIAIGDFGVATIMADARTKTRTLVGSMNWMAPEVLERPYDERSDVWSLGCIILEMTSCGFCDAAEMAGKLYEIKHNPVALEELLEEAAKHYSPDMLSVIRTMLRRNYQQRPTAVELLETPFINECLSLSNSALAEKRKREKSAAARRPLPRDTGIQAVIEYLVDTLGNETCVKNSFEYLAEITKEDGATLDAMGKKVIAKGMKDYMSEVDVQIHGCQIMNNLMVTASANDPLYSREIISVVPLAMKSHLGSAALQQVAAGLLMALSAEEQASQLIGELGGVQDILTAMRTFPNNTQLCATSCNALWSLTVNEDNARIVTEEKGVNDIVAAIKAHPDSPEVIEAAEAVLLALSMEDENMDTINKLDCVGLILEAMEKHIREAKVVKNGCMALAAMVEPDEESAYKVLTNIRDKQEIQGIPIILKAYDQHKDNAEVVENICTLLMELVEYDEILAEIKHLKIHEGPLTEIHKRFKDNVDVMKPCESALSKLGGGRVQLRK